MWVANAFFDLPALTAALGEPLQFARLGESVRGATFGRVGPCRRRFLVFGFGVACAVSGLVTGVLAAAVHVPAEQAEAQEGCGDAS